MVVNFTSSTPKVQVKPALTFESNVTALPKIKKDTVHFTAKAEKSEPAGEKLSILPNLVKGIIKPVKDIFKSLVEAPLATGLVIAATAAVIATLPIVGTALAIGICGFGAYKMTSGTIKAIKNHKKGDDATANKNVQLVGEGLFDVALTARAAYKGVNKVANTADAIKEAAKQVAGEGKNLSFYEKMYAIVQQVQKSDTIPQGPKTFNDFLARIKEDALKELAALKETITGNAKKVSVPEIEQILNKVDKLDPKQLEQAASAFDKIAAALKDGPAKDAVQKAAGWMKDSQVDKIIANKGAILDALNGSNLESLARDPEIVKIVNQIMKATNPDEAVSIIRKVAKVPTNEEAAKLIGATDVVTGEDNKTNLE